MAWCIHQTAIVFYSYKGLSIYVDWLDQSNCHSKRGTHGLFGPGPYPTILGLTFWWMLAIWFCFYLDWQGILLLPHGRGCLAETLQVKWVWVVALYPFGPTISAVMLKNVSREIHCCQYCCVLTDFSTSTLLTCKGSAREVSSKLAKEESFIF